MNTGDKYRTHVHPEYIDIYKVGEIHTVEHYIQGYSLIFEKRVIIRAVDGCFLYYSVFLSREILTSYEEFKQYLLNIKELGYEIKPSSKWAILRYSRARTINFRILDSKRVAFNKITDVYYTSLERSFWLKLFPETP